MYKMYCIFSGESYGSETSNSNSTLRCGSGSSSVPCSPTKRPLTCNLDATLNKLGPKTKLSVSPNTKRRSFSPSLLRKSFFNRQSNKDLTQYEDKCSGCGLPVTDDRRVSVKRTNDTRDVYHTACFTCSV